MGDADVGDLKEILSEELNVESLENENDLERFQKIELKPNRKSLGEVHLRPTRCSD